jgi:hypothetical protein
MIANLTDLYDLLTHSLDETNLAVSLQCQYYHPVLLCHPIILFFYVILIFPLVIVFVVFFFVVGGRCIIVINVGNIRPVGMEPSPQIRKCFLLILMDGCDGKTSLNARDTYGESRILIILHGKIINM